MSISMRCAMLALALVACSSDGTSDDDDVDPPRILIEGSDMGPRFQNFRISQPGGSIAGALVSLNGTQIPEDPDGMYNYELGTTVPPGQDLVIRVQIGSDVAEGRATIMAPPTLTAPTDGQSFTRGAPITVTWTSAEQADYWRVFLSYSANGGGTAITDSVAASARSHVLSTGSIPANATSTTISVFGYRKGTFTGLFHPASNMRVRAPSVTTGITLTP